MARPKETLSVRIPAELMDKINGLAAETRRDKTSVVVDLLTQKLDKVEDSPHDCVSNQRFEAAIARLSHEVAELKKLELVA
jgi:predicted transcriptional regulator